MRVNYVRVTSSDGISVFEQCNGFILQNNKCDYTAFIANDYLNSSEVDVDTYFRALQQVFPFTYEKKTNGFDISLNFNSFTKFFYNSVDIDNNVLVKKIMLSCWQFVRFSFAHYAPYVVNKFITINNNFCLYLKLLYSTTDVIHSHNSPWEDGIISLVDIDFEEYSNREFKEKILKLVTINTSFLFLKNNTTRNSNTVTLRITKLDYYSHSLYVSLQKQYHQDSKKFVLLNCWRTLEEGLKINNSVTYNTKELENIPDLKKQLSICTSTYYSVYKKHNLTSSEINEKTAYYEISQNMIKALTEKHELIGLWKFY